MRSHRNRSHSRLNKSKNRRSHNRRSHNRRLRGGNNCARCGLPRSDPIHSPRTGGINSHPFYDYVDTPARPNYNPLNYSYSYSPQPAYNAPISQYHSAISAASAAAPAAPAAARQTPAPYSSAERNAVQQTDLEASWREKELRRDRKINSSLYPNERDQGMGYYKNR